MTQKLLWIIEKTTEYSIDENPPCGINDPLENIKWLKEYCESINEIEDLSSINIDIYKVIDKDEYLFFVKYSIEYQDYKRVRLNSINCNGDTVFHFTWMYGKRGFVPVPPNLARYDEFMEDKEFVAGLLYFVK